MVNGENGPFGPFSIGPNEKWTIWTKLNQIGPNGPNWTIFPMVHFLIHGPENGTFSPVLADKIALPGRLALLN